MAIQFASLYKAALRYLGVRLRSEHEMRMKIRYIIKKNLSQDEHIEDLRELEDRVISQLYKDTYLDDLRFATEWVASRLRNKPRGLFVLRSELQLKGINKDIIHSVLSQFSTINSDADQLYDSALKLAHKYLRRYQGLPAQESQFKLVRALSQKGFDSGLIHRVIDALFSTSYNDAG